MAYNYIGSLGLFFYTFITLIPLTYKFFIYELRLYNLTYKLITFYSIFLFIIYLMGGIVFGGLSLESFRYVLLPLAFISGLTFWQQIRSKLLYVSGLINTIKFYILFSVFSWILILIGNPYIAKIYNFYAAGAAFTESYITRVRYFGLAGQPAISAYLISFTWFVLIAAIKYREFIVGKKAGVFQGLYFITLLIAMFSTFSRASILSFIMAGLTSFVILKIKNISKKFKFNLKISLKKIFLLTTFSVSIPLTFNALSNFSRFGNIMDIQTALIRFIKYGTVIDLISNNILYFLFGYLLNSEAMISESIRLYVTDSNFAFFLSNTGILGLLLFLLIYIFISYNLISFPKVNFEEDKKLTKLKDFIFLISNWLTIYIFVVCIFDPPLLDAKCLFFIGMFVQIIYELKNQFINANKSKNFKIEKNFEKLNY